MPRLISVQNNNLLLLDYDLKKQTTYPLSILKVEYTPHTAFQKDQLIYRVEDEKEIVEPNPIYAEVGIDTSFINDNSNCRLKITNIITQEVIITVDYSLPLSKFTTRFCKEGDGLMHKILEKIANEIMNAPIIIKSV